MKLRIYDFLGGCHFLFNTGLSNDPVWRIFLTVKSVKKNSHTNDISLSKSLYQYYFFQYLRNKQLAQSRKKWLSLCHMSYRDSSWQVTNVIETWHHTQQKKSIDYIIGWWRRIETLMYGNRLGMEGSWTEVIAVKICFCFLFASFWKAQNSDTARCNMNSWTPLPAQLLYIFMPLAKISGILFFSGANASPFTIIFLFQMFCNQPTG